MKKYLLIILDSKELYIFFTNDHSKVEEEYNFCIKSGSECHLYELDSERIYRVIK